MTVTTAVRLSPSAQAWRDPEFWGPPGQGCARCDERPPLVHDAGFEGPFNGALCEDCLGRCFPGWSFDRLVDWLGRQRETLVRNKRRAAALTAAGWGDMTPAMDYEKEYGVWLITWRPSP